MTDKHLQTESFASSYSEEIPLEKRSFREIMITVLNQNKSLNLTAQEVAFLAGLDAFCKREGSFRLTEVEIHNLFATLDEETGGLIETREQRADTLLRKLQDQKLVLRLSAFSTEDASLYRLTRLSESIVSDRYRQELLSSETIEKIFDEIELFLDGLIKEIEDYKIRAQSHDVSINRDEFWKSKVKSPLVHVVSTLIESIEQRQMGLEQAQIKTQETFEQMYSNDHSMSGIARCEQLLSSVAAKLKELNRAMMDGAGLLKEQMLRIEELADDDHQTTIAEHSRMIYENLDQVIEWAQISGKKWSEYYQNAHEFLRSAIRLDQRRAFSGRLRKEITSYSDSPWQLLICTSHPLMTLKDESEVQEIETLTRDMSAYANLEANSSGTPDVRLTAKKKVEAYLADLGWPAKDETCSIDDEVIRLSVKQHLSQLLPEFDHAAFSEEDEDVLYHTLVQTIFQLTSSALKLKTNRSPSWNAINEKIEVQELDFDTILN